MLDEHFEQKVYDEYLLMEKKLNTYMVEKTKH